MIYSTGVDGVDVENADADVDADGSDDGAEDFDNNDDADDDNDSGIDDVDDDGVDDDYDYVHSSILHYNWRSDCCSPRALFLEEKGSG